MCSLHMAPTAATFVKTLIALNVNADEQIHEEVVQRTVRNNREATASAPATDKSLGTAQHSKGA